MKNSINKDQIILIGPLAVGKSTIALALSEMLNIKNFPVDRLKWYYRLKNGYDLAHGTKILTESGFLSLIEYANNYFGLEEIIEIFSSFEGIIDLGATDIYSQDKHIQVKLIEFFTKFTNIILILPSSSVKESNTILSERLFERLKDNKLKFPVLESYISANEIMIESGIYQRVSKKIVYTNNRSVQEVCTEIINWIHR